MPLGARGLELLSIAIGKGKYQNRWEPMSPTKKKNKVKKTNDEAINFQLPKNAYEEVPIVELRPIPPKEMGKEASS